MTTKDEALRIALEALGELRKNPALKYEHTFVDAAITAIKQAQQAQEPRLMRDCFDLLDFFEYENDEDSQSKAFFKAHINVDWFFHVKNSLERQLPPGAKK
jgi:hypothetical protein